MKRLAVGSVLVLLWAAAAVAAGIGASRAAEETSAAATGEAGSETPTAAGTQTTTEPDPAGEAGSHDDANGADSACVTCHQELDDELLAPVQNWSRDVHAEAGLGCEACHGGDASPELGFDALASKSEASGFRGKPERLDIPVFCGSCHADADFMKQFNPGARVDQLAEYGSSAHGKGNAGGDTVPAVCTDCHGVHGIRPVSSPDSRVYATNVPQTCSSCHSDAEKMAPYGLATDQYDDYLGSVHAMALFEMEDTAAPACNDCHGNHGAAPPGVQSVANVCGQCHGRESRLFRASFKKDLFDAMEVSECAVCHDHHRIQHPTPDLFHFGSEPSASTGRIMSTEPFEVDLGSLKAGETATASWIVTLGSHLLPGDPRLLHRVQVSAAGQEPLGLSATVEPGEKLEPGRVHEAATGKFTARLAIEAPSGSPVKAGDSLALQLKIKAKDTLTGLLVRDRPGEGVAPVKGSACLLCHTPGDRCDQASERMYDALVSLERELRDAESLLHRAEVAGMEVSGAQFELKSQGTTAAVEAKALIHGFDPDVLVKRTEEGMAVAAQARQSGVEAMDEIQYRRKGLAVSLLLIGLVLVGLYFKIRQTNRFRAPREKDALGASSS